MLISDKEKTAKQVSSSPNRIMRLRANKLCQVLFAAMVAISSLQSLPTTATAQDNIENASTDLTEMQLISELSNADKSYAYFKLTITENTYTTGIDNPRAHLAINAYATSFMSDPDIFVSKTEHVDRLVDAAWHSTREGSDTCIIHSDDFEIGDTLFITVFCMNECTYDLRPYYAEEYDLEDGERMVFRWGGHVTNILRYLVPDFTDIGATYKFEISLEPEIDYKYLEVYLSHDSKYSVIEDRPARHITDEGLSVFMTSEDTRWCVNCYVYLIVNMIEDKRLYVTSQAKTVNEGLETNIENHLLANGGSLECKSYSIGSIKNDALFYFSNFQGDADFFMAKRTLPSSISSSAVVLQTKISYPQQVLLANVIDREYWSAQLGIYYICAQAYDSLSSKLQVEEGPYNGKLAGQFALMYNFYLHTQTSQQFVFTKPIIKTQNAKINIEAGVYGSGNGDITDLQIFYKICRDETEGCFFTAEEASGTGQVERLQVVTVRSTDKDGESRGQTIFSYSAEISHESSMCQGGTVCNYVFSVYNPSTFTAIRQVTLLVDIETQEIQDILPDVPYVNKVSKGQYQLYRILDSQFDLEYIYKVTIDLKTYLGDADLFVSTSADINRPTKDQFNHLSCQKDHFDQVILTDTVNDWLSDYIYISVYGEIQSEFELSFKVEYHPIQNEKLVYAQPLNEKVSVFGSFANEFGDSFYSYRPWWSMHENRSIILLADSPLQEVTFYLQVDDYPLVYNTDWVDYREMFALHPWDAGYSTAEGHFGSYYVRVRPAYNIADLLVDTPYSYFFRAFSQPAGDGLTDLYQNDELAGMAFEGQNTYYRHFLTDDTVRIRVTLERLQGKGLPILFVKFANEKVLPKSVDFQSYDAKNETSSGKGSVYIDMERSWRASQGHPDCDQAGYWKNGGSELCTLYIGVECDESEPMCAYKIRLEVFDGINQAGEQGELIDYTMARYIPRDQDYVDVKIPYGEIVDFYYPVQPDESGDILIFANKTGAIGKNGDTWMLLNIQKNSAIPNIYWYTANNAHPDGTGKPRYVIESATQDPIQPEMIDICQEKLQEACANDALENPNCSLIVSLMGITPDLDSNVRLRVFDGSNKLFSEKPIQGTHDSGKGTFKYYWFLSKGAMEADEWQHTIALGIKTEFGADFDLYVSVMDGRYPTDNDYDFKSTNYGADSIFISSENPMFQNSNSESWDPSVGMVVVVGVKSLQDSSADFSLVMNGPNQVVYEISQLETDIYQQVSVNIDPERSEENPYVRVFKWYNWGHGNFDLEVKAISGAANFYFNHISETSYQDNAFSAIGLNANNSQWGAHLNTTEPEISIKKLSLTRQNIETRPQFCYNCWYYITVIIDTPIEVEYRVWVERLQDAGTDLEFMPADESRGFEMINIGNKRYYKFIFASKDSFELEVKVATGKVRVNIYLNPDEMDNDFAVPNWSMTQSVGSGFLPVATDDPNFHLGTYYYVTVTQLDNTRVSGSMTLSQLNMVQSMANAVSKKLQFFYDRELVKYVVFQVPTTWSQFSTSVIEIEKLCSSLYPTVYLKKIELDRKPDRLDQLEYPSIQEHDRVFGDNFSTMLNEDKLVFEIGTQSIAPYTYYTMAIYQNSYGMTDMRKPEFKLTVTSKEISVQSVLALRASSPTLIPIEKEEEISAASEEAMGPHWFQTRLQDAKEFFFTQ